MLSERVVLSIESTENFDKILDQYIEKFNPQDGVEMGMVEQMAACFWRMQRGFNLEKETFDNALDNHREGDQPKRLQAAWAELSFGTSLQNAHRYQTMLDRMHTRTMKNLLMLRKMQPENPELPNEPNPGFGHSETPPPHSENGKIAGPQPVAPSERAEAPADAAKGTACSAAADAHRQPQPANYTGRSTICSDAASHHSFLPSRYERAAMITATA